MSYSVAASHSVGKFATDKIFGAAALAAKAVAQVGKENVTNATIGALLDDDGKLVCLPSVEAAFRALPITEIINYAPIAGLPDFLNAAMDHVFGESRPEAYTNAVATSGGSGVLHHAIWNYTELHDTVLTTDWYWGPYKVLCEEVLRKLTTFPLFDENSNSTCLRSRRKPPSCWPNKTTCSSFSTRRRTILPAIRLRTPNGTESSPY